jgi:Glycosyl transferases group 1
MGSQLPQRADGAPVSGRVFVVGAYLPNGGTYMAYHLARMLQVDFGWQAIAVEIAGERREDSVQDYDVVFPTMTVDEMEKAITERDILIANPSFSFRWFGPRLPGRKLMYIQHFNTFKVLDTYFDHYVYVGDVISRFVSTTYGLSAPTIHPFIELERFPKAPAWQDRPAGSILVHLKGDPTLQRVLLERLRQRVNKLAPDINLSKFLHDQPVRHLDLVRRLGQHRYLLTLSVAEGCPLIPLEAMAMGTTLVGFDGFGGREYMEPGINCLTASYPNIDEVADNLVTAVRDPALAERLTQAGRITAQQYSYARFRAAWHEQFAHFLQLGNKGHPMR